MRALFWFLGLFALAVGLAVAARFNEGYVLIVQPPYRVELSFNFMVLLLAAFFLLGWTLIQVVLATLRLPKSVNEYRQTRRREKAAATLREALRYLWEGRYGHARKAAEEAHAMGESRGLAALIAARASHAMRDTGASRSWLELAGSEGGDMSTARNMTAAELAIDRRSHAEALEALGEVGKGGARHIAAMRLSLRAHQGAGDWDEVVRLSQQLEKHGAMPPEQAATLRRQAHRENLARLAGSPDQLGAYWKKLPAAGRCDPLLAGQAARALMAQGACDQAAALIENALDGGGWDAELARLYGDCAAGDPLPRIARAESWLKARPEEPELLLTLGMLCLRERLWGKAQSYLEASLAVRPTRHAHLELARLLDQLGKADDAVRHYRALADLPA